MTESNLYPLTISLHKQSKILEIVYDDGVIFELPCEYLRVFSPSAEVKGHGPGQDVLQIGKENIIIFKFNNLKSPLDTFSSPDARKLGILLKSLKITKK